MNGEHGGNKEAQNLFIVREGKANGGKTFLHGLQLVAAMEDGGKDI